MVSVQHPHAPVHFSPSSPYEIDTSDYSTPFIPTVADEAERLALLSDDEARDEVLDDCSRRDRFESWVAAMEAAYGHLPDGPASDDDRCGLVGHSSPYED